jgi:hypothetical protein
MSVYEFIKRCLEKEAARTEPDKGSAIKMVLGEIEKRWKIKT